MARLRFGRSANVSAEALAPLSRDDVDSAVESAIVGFGLELVVEGPGVWRVFGSPGTLDWYLLTVAYPDEGMVTVECAVPVLVPEARLEQILNLCLGLNTQGRVAFGIGRRGTPVACHTQRLLGGSRDKATSLCAASFEQAWMKASAAEDLFAAVVEGSDAAAVLQSLNHEDNPELFGALPINPRSQESPRGTQWVDALAEARPLPSDMPVSDSFTEREIQGIAAALSLVSVAAGPILDMCGGPLLIHADGVVECYGCDEPSSNGHAPAGTISCSEGLYLGQGHRCERCSQPL